MRLCVPIIVRPRQGSHSPSPKHLLPSMCTLEGPQLPQAAGSCWGRRGSLTQPGLGKGGWASEGRGLPQALITWGLRQKKH